ncbi:sensor histidine kinase [Roseateles saccharophilus]|uniref:histidine kinase n=2 Tax=Roseateles saccharophilus TaxID=304 RepID=A0A4R3VJ53_ROSSA|nr:HAMP domain-containing sensor histidine kinase [Roseateles saccharophilus]MDG0832830.1 HAMP domain-containing histidine kinase [Roseateles saccharophilus]TCV03809.1 signal transduction histidine kinase [Roseateles saccharophilus]
MKSLYVRIYLTLVALLLAFAFGSAWLFQRHIEQERGNVELVAGERLNAMAGLLKLALPAATAAREDQADVFADWGGRLRMPIALVDAEGRRIAATVMFQRRVDDPGAIVVSAGLGDGRSLEMVRTVRPGPPQGGLAGPPGGGPGARPQRLDEGPWAGPWLHRPVSPNAPAVSTLAIVLVLLFVGVAAGAYPVVRRLTRRLEVLKRGVEQFGAGQLGHRVDDSGSDEVAALAGSFNQAADRIETLLRSHQSLLANASHELRSPLARLKMAFAMLEDAGPAQRERLAREIDVNIAELDALVEEVLLASRLEAGSALGDTHAVELLALGAEEAARSEVAFEPETDSARIDGQERLLRRALRNLLDNARRYGGPEVQLTLRPVAGGYEFVVADRGPGVPAEMRERIFEPFFRLPGHAEMAGGVGLGLSLVKQIAERHGGSVRCLPRDGGGSRFVLFLPASRR